ncbi:hypothetical protein HH214_03335 [Mucilaginibacter robiniae]|uniref:Uncharacterized protein n=1 Tax=Mucilaginibacter robiniae TaxID=2728022 RepID=A0A7L5DW65_9SPHI|nr:hypothetical protein [Mucilaginibacter robiniae]QJD94981.1 hypothetical protein HH214_03335 [Mucilaginibacter robiniae]
MSENSTTLKTNTGKAMVKGRDMIECAEADEVIFFHALRTELDRLQKRPKQHTIDNILQHSRNLR